MCMMVRSLYWTQFLSCNNISCQILWSNPLSIKVPVISRSLRNGGSREGRGRDQESKWNGKWNKFLGTLWIITWFCQRRLIFLVLKFTFAWTIFSDSLLVGSIREEQEGIEDSYKSCFLNLCGFGWVIWPPVSEGLFPTIAIPVGMGPGLV